METMADWFGLKEGRRDFSIENLADAKILFARASLDDELQAILRRSSRTGSPPKLVLYGDWGVGKTHTMRHIEHVISANPEFKAQCVFVELPDITSRSNFQVAHAALLDALGLERSKSWMVHFQTKHQSASQGLIQKETQSEDIAKAFLTLIGYGESARICWDWLRGESLSAPEARSVGLPVRLDQSNQLVAVLRMLGRLSQEIDDKVLVLMVDEAIKLADVANSDAIAHWRNAFKILADKGTKEIGFIISATFLEPDDMPTMLADEQIRSRFGMDHYIRLNNFGPDETKAFVSALLSNWVDDAKRDTLISRHESEKGGEVLTATTFPFTELALHEFVDYACRRGGITNPRDVQTDLDKVLNRAIDDGLHLLSSGYMRALTSGA